MTTKPIPAICNEGCNKEFKITKFRTRIVKGGNEKTYFLCTHCKHEYIAYYASPETKKLQALMRKLHRDVYKHNSQIDMKVFYQQEQELKNKIKQSMDEARAVSES